MTSEVLFKGKSVAQAIENACQQLDIKEENLNYEVVSEGSTGIFGLVGARKVQMWVIIQEKQIDSVVDHGESASDAVPREDGVTASTELSKPARIGQEALDKIASGITDGASVRTQDEGRRIAFQIDGGKAGVLIGKCGQTLEAIQYLVEKVVNRSSRERIRVSIDVGGYLAKKRKNLENLAEKKPRKPKRTANQPPLVN